MIFEQVIAKLARHWRIYVLLLSLLIGGILIYPAFRFIPILLDLMTVKRDQSQTVAEASMNLISATITEQPHNNFLPLIKLGDPLIENEQIQANIELIWKAIDFSPNGEQITIQIQPRDNRLGVGLPVEISFLPREQCAFGDSQACIYQFTLSNQSKVVFASVHSGVGGEGEYFRDLIEGTGINQGLFSTDQVRVNLHALIGSEITITQGDTHISGLSLAAIARIPPTYLETYLSLPIEGTLPYAAELAVLSPEIINQDMLVFETCGWQLPDEHQVSGYSTTTGSIYLGIIR